MSKLKGARVEGNTLILTTPIETEEEFSEIVTTWYGSKIPIFKPVGFITSHGTRINGADSAAYNDIRIYDFVDMLKDYIPVEPKKLSGAYTKQGDAVDFDISVQSRALFRNRALVRGRTTTSIVTMSPFTSALDMNKIIQVHARINDEELKSDSEWLNIDKNRGDIYYNYIERDYMSAKLDGIFLPERLSVEYKDFLYYGYDTWSLNHKDHPMCLVNKPVELLFKSGDSRARFRTPIIICYKGTGIMNAASIEKTLFDEPVQEFHPFEHVRFCISDYVNINMASFVPGSNKLQLIFTSDVNAEALQKILQDYEEVD